MRRRNSILVLGATLLAIACMDRSITGPDKAISPDVSDAVHNSGRTHFYLLPPMVSAPTTSGKFDATVSPVVDVCPSNGTACTDSAIATFTTTSGVASEVIRVSTTDEQYIVNWHTDVSGISSGSIYRIRVKVGGSVVGFADVSVLANAGEAKNVATGAYIPLVDGKTLPIKFRIEQGMPVSISVDPATLTVIQRKSGALSASVKDAHGQVLSTQPVSWTTTDTTIALVGGTGIVTGVAVGLATITASTEAISASAQVNVILPPVASIEVSPATATITTGKNGQLTATLKDADGNILSGRTITWNSSDQTIATVDAAGKVTGVSSGSADVTATSEGKSASTHVTVVVPAVASVAVSPNPASLTVGKSTQLTATIKDAEGSLLTGRSIAWTSNASGATVASDGLVTGITAGTYTITATVDGVAGTSTVTVVDAFDLGALPGATVSEALAVNDGGEIVGWSAIPSGLHHAVLWRSGSIIDLGTLPGGTRSEAYSINSDGTIVGFSDGAGFQSHAVVWSSTTPYAITDLGTFPTGTTSVARGISNAGVIVGAGFTQIPGYAGAVGDHAFKYSGNSMEDLGIRLDEIYGMQTTKAHGVSDNGTIIGTGLAYWTNEPWGWIQYPNDPIMYRPKGLDNGNSSIPLAINANGQMAGLSRMSCPEAPQPNLCDEAVYWNTSSGQGIALVDYATIRSSRATGINGVGDAVGYAVIDGLTHGMYWSGGAPGGAQLDPVPNVLGTLPQAINNSRLIVGYVNLPSGPRAFQYQVH